MRSRAARAVLVLLALIVLAAAASLVFVSERQIAVRRSALRAFDLSARQTADGVAEARAAQQAYVAQGQGVEFWLPKVGALLASANQSVDGLLRTAISTDARAALTDAAATLADLGAIDKRVREQLAQQQLLMASDIIFTEGGETAAGAGRLIESARLTERQTFDLFEAQKRTFEISALGGAAFFFLVVTVVLAAAAPAARRAVAEPPVLKEIDPRDEESSAMLIREAPVQGHEVPVQRHDMPVLQLAPQPVDVPAPSVPRSVPGSSELTMTLAVDFEPDELLLVTSGEAQSETGPLAKAVLKAAEKNAGAMQAMMDAALLCTDLCRVNDPEALNTLLGRAAKLLDATGVIVWVGPTDAAVLKPTLVWGYSPQMLSRMPALPTSADNAAAEAFRTGALQVVAPRGNSLTGAIVAPLLAPEGCIGALAAEVGGGAQSSETRQALAEIVAAQLAGLLGGSAAVAVDEAPPARRANG